MPSRLQLPPLASPVRKREQLCISLPLPVHSLSIIETPCSVSSWPPMETGNLRSKAKLWGTSEQQEASEVQGHGPPACGHALALYQLLPPSPQGSMGGSGEVGLASPPPPRYNQSAVLFINGKAGRKEKSLSPSK